MSLDYSIYSNLTLDELRGVAEEYMNEFVQQGYLTFFTFSTPSELDKEVLEEEGFGTGFVSMIYTNVNKELAVEAGDALRVLRNQISKHAKCLVLLNGESELPLIRFE